MGRNSKYNYTPGVKPLDILKGLSKSSIRNKLSKKVNKLEKSLKAEK